MTEPLVSVIIPVYNVSGYLRSCLDSLSAQSNPDWEGLLINDGSTDGSGDICREYAAKESRFKYYEQPNAGLSAARNLGLDNARGKYILFLDSDDRFTPDAIESMTKAAEKYGEAEIIASKAAFRCTDSGEREPYNEISLRGMMGGSEFLAARTKLNVFNTVWMYLYSRELIEKNKLRFLNGALHEDELWVPQAFTAAKKIATADCVFYCYTVNPTSITGKKRSAKNYTDYIKIYALLENIYIGVEKQYRNTLRDKLARQYIYTAARLLGEDFAAEIKGGIDWKLIRRNIKTTKTLLKYIMLKLAPDKLRKIQSNNA